MKFSHLLIALFIGGCIGLIACNSKKDDQTTTDPATTMTTDGAPASDPAAASATPASSSGTEPHYKCTKAGCTGSGPSQGKCPVCGSDLVHNQAFHAQAQPQGAQGSTPANPIQVDPNTGQGNQMPSQPAAKNAKGEFHYTCPNGHDGAASAGNCAKCGAALVHNQAYHNN